MMTGTERSTADLDPPRRMILYRAWHRGMRETDLILGPFADAHLAFMTDDEIQAFEAMLEVSDREILGWITGSLPFDDAYDATIFKRIVAFHTHSKPINI